MAAGSAAMAEREGRDDASAAPGTDRHPGRRAPGHLGAVHVLQLLLVEVAAFGALAITGSGATRLIWAGLAGVLVLGVMLARWRGRWWLERVVLRRRYRRRRAAVPDPDEPDLRLSLLRCLAADLVVTEVTGPDGGRLGIGYDGAGWYAAAQIDPPSSLRGDATGRVPVEELVRSLDEAGQPGAVVQLLTGTVPAPVADQGSTLRPAFDISYREILGAAVLPADRATWVAVRLDVRALAQAGVLDGASLGGAELGARVPAVAGALVRRLAKALRRHGLVMHILDAPGLLDAVAGACGIPADRSALRDLPRERWRGWGSPGLAHACFWVRHWPDPGRLPAVMDTLAAPPAGSTTWLSLLLSPHADGVDLQCLVRVSAAPDALERACHEVAQRAGVLGAELFRLDGEHGPAVYATAPTGGGAR